MAIIFIVLFFSVGFAQSNDDRARAIRFQHAQDSIQNASSHDSSLINDDEDALSDYPITDAPSTKPDIDFAQLAIYEKNAQSFEIEKVKIGCTLKSFLEKYPTAEKHKSLDAAVGAKLYFVRHLKSAEDGMFGFYNNKLYKISFSYRNAQINTSGAENGSLLFAKTMIKKIGKGQFAKFEGYTLFVWNFVSVNRYFVLKLYENLDMYLIIQNSAIIDKIEKEKKKITDFDF